VKVQLVAGILIGVTAAVMLLVVVETYRAW